MGSDAEFEEKVKTFKCNGKVGWDESRGLVADFPTADALRMGTGSTCRQAFSYPCTVAREILIDASFSVPQWCGDCHDQRNIRVCLAEVTFEQTSDGVVLVLGAKRISEAAISGVKGKGKATVAVSCSVEEEAKTLTDIVSNLV